MNVSPSGRPVGSAAFYVQRSAAASLAAAVGNRPLMAGVFTPAYGRLSAGTSRRPTRTIPGRGAPTTSALVAHVSTPLVANHRSDRPASPRVDDRAARRRGDLGSFRAAIRGLRRRLRGKQTSAWDENVLANGAAFTHGEGGLSCGALAHRRRLTTSIAPLFISQDSGKHSPGKGE